MNEREKTKAQIMTMINQADDMDLAKICESLSCFLDQPKYNQSKPIDKTAGLYFALDANDKFKVHGYIEALASADKYNRNLWKVVK